MTKAKNNYTLPLPKKSVQKWTKRGSSAHKGKLKHSLDFTCEEGTPVYASCSGEVVWVKDDSNKGGNHRRYWFDGNRIVLKHKNGEYSAYEHLQYQGAMVKVGEEVRKKQLIGYSGNTGFSEGPHLHFEVFIKPNKEESEGTTVRIEMKKLRSKK